MNTRTKNALVRKPLIGGNAKFRAGFAFVQRDVIVGWTPDESFDLASSVTGAGSAFMDGANCARHLYSGHRAFAQKIATSYQAVCP